MLDRYDLTVSGDSPNRRPIWRLVAPLRTSANIARSIRLTRRILGSFGLVGRLRLAQQIADLGEQIPLLGHHSSDFL